MDMEGRVGQGMPRTNGGALVVAGRDEEGADNDCALSGTAAAHAYQLASTSIYIYIYVWYVMGIYVFPFMSHPVAKTEEPREGDIWTRRDMRPCARRVRPFICAHSTWHVDVYTHSGTLVDTICAREICVPRS